MKQMKEMEKYKNDLDQISIESKMMRSRSSVESYPTSQPLSHNTIINPMSYNIQNPYILKEMKDQSHLANLGNKNF